MTLASERSVFQGSNLGEPEQMKLYAEELSLASRSGDFTRSDSRLASLRWAEGLGRTTLDESLRQSLGRQATLEGKADKVRRSITCTQALLHLACINGDWDNYRSLPKEKGPLEVLKQPLPGQWRHDDLPQESGSRWSKRESMDDGAFPILRFAEPLSRIGFRLGRPGEEGIEAVDVDGEESVRLARVLSLARVTDFVVKPKLARRLPMDLRVRPSDTQFFQLEPDASRRMDDVVADGSRPKRTDILPARSVLLAQQAIRLL